MIEAKEFEVEGPCEERIAGCLSGATFGSWRFGADPLDEIMQWICAILTENRWILGWEVHPAIRSGQEARAGLQKVKAAD